MNVLKTYRVPLVRPRPCPVHKRGRPADVAYMTDCALQREDREPDGGKCDCDGAGNVKTHGALGRGGEITTSGHEEDYHC